MENLPKHCVSITDRVYLGQVIPGFQIDGNFRCIYLNQSPHFQHLFCDEIGQFNTSSMIDFIGLLDAELSSAIDTKVVICVQQGARAISSAIFLVGAYMIVKKHMAPERLAAAFAPFEPSLMQNLSDSNRAQPQLHLIDCWSGLAKGRVFGWIRYGGPEFMWGAVDVDEYRHFDNPSNGSMHEVVPGKFIMIQEPADLGGADFSDDARGLRAFSPAFCANTLRDMGAKALVSLGKPRYDPAQLTSRGFTHHILDYEGGAAPSGAAAAAFLRAAEAPGKMAVHCGAAAAGGEGRAATLVALWLVRECRFGAREALGWLRVMRPGPR